MGSADAAGELAGGPEDGEDGEGGGDEQALPDLVVADVAREQRAAALHGPGERVPVGHPAQPQLVLVCEPPRENQLTRRSAPPSILPPHHQIDLRRAAPPREVHHVIDRNAKFGHRIAIAALTDTARR